MVRFTVRMSPNRTSIHVEREVRPCELPSCEGLDLFAQTEDMFRIKWSLPWDAESQICSCALTIFSPDTPNSSITWTDVACEDGEVGVKLPIATLQTYAQLCTSPTARACPPHPYLQEASLLI
jgi:hypothetical protein